MLSEPDRPGVPHPAYRNAGAVWMGLTERALEHARPDRLERRLADCRTVPNPACAAILARRGTDGRKPRCRTPSRRDSRRRCGRVFSAANARAAVLAGQIEKLALDLGEQAWRKEAKAKIPGLPGMGSRPAFGHSSTLCPETMTQHGSSSSPTARRTFTGISIPTVSPDGGECVIGRMTTKRGRDDQSPAARRQAGRSLPWSRPAEASRSHR